jgi:hypothetical protein
MESMMEIEDAVGSPNSAEWKSQEISEANAWRMVVNTTSCRETAADHTPSIHSHP